MYSHEERRRRHIPSFSGLLPHPACRSSGCRPVAAYWVDLAAGLARVLRCRRVRGICSLRLLSGPLHVWGSRARCIRNEQRGAFCRRYGESRPCLLQFGCMGGHKTQSSVSAYGRMPDTASDSANSCCSDINDSAGITMSSWALNSNLNSTSCRRLMH